MKYKKPALKSKTIHIKRLFNVKASVRDYTLRNIINGGFDLILECSGQRMFIPNSLILKLEKKSKFTIKSKYNNNFVSLVDFPFNPNRKNTPNQITLFNDLL